MLVSATTAPPGDSEADETAEQANAGGFDQELDQNSSAFSADGFANADLAGALGNGNKHDVHDSNAAYE